MDIELGKDKSSEEESEKEKEYESADRERAYYDILDGMKLALRFFEKQIVDIYNKRK